jgi:hypothetical protein
MSDGNFKLENQVISSQGSQKDGNFVFIGESRLEKVVISKKGKKSSSTGKDEKINFELIPWTSGDVVLKSPLRSISFSESMFNGSMYGSMYVFDYRNWIDEFGFDGTEELEIQLKLGIEKNSPSENSNDDENAGRVDKLLKFKFNIYNAKSVTDDTIFVEGNPLDETVSVWRLDFISSQIFLPNYLTPPFHTWEKEDYVGKLSVEKGSTGGLVKNLN